jgi:tellurite resistance protein
MGVTGLGIAWRKAGELVAAPPLVGESILILATVLFAAITVLYGAKAVRFPKAVVQEFRHPIRANFFPAFSISILLLSLGALPHAPSLALGLWAVGSVLHLGLTVTLLKRWILHDTHLAHSNPAWFIPIVGNIIAPLSAPALGFMEIAWFFFSIGVVFWLVLMTLLVYRIIFHDPLPVKILPTLFIFMAPPSVGYLSYIGLTEGVVDGFARVLIYTALFIALLLTSMIRNFLKVPFAVSWWAFTFPSAALAGAVLDYGARVGGPPILTALGWGVLALATLIVTVVLIRTVAALLGGRLFIPD